jgi:glycosyltransferase involved in cell wall biosynthesis
MSNPIRILEIIGLLERGGVEVWLMEMLRNIDRSAFQIEFLVHVDYPCAFDDEARNLGARILRLKQPKLMPLSYRRKLAGLLRKHGPYDVVHSHVHFRSGFNLQVAARCGVPIRIAHSHGDLRRLHQRAGILRKCYGKLAQRRINQYATLGLASSAFAAASLFGEQWRCDPRWQIFHPGLDFSRFARPIQPESLRKKLGIPNDRHVISHLSRLDPQKNHSFSLRLFQELLKSGMNAHLLIIGGGAMEQSLRAQIAAANLNDRVTMAGDQADVVPFLALTDCMLFPSMDEGLGIVVLEAQAMGVSTVASDCVPPDVSVLPGMVEFLPLDAPLAQWIAAVQAKLEQQPLNPTEAVRRMQASDFSVDQCLKKLCGIYGGSSNRTPAAEPMTDFAISKMRAAGAQ